MSLLEKLTLDDLDADQRQLAECIGMEAYRKLLKNYAGSDIRVRMPKRITIPVRNMEIKNKFNGGNYGKLAREYDLSEDSIRKIVSSEIKRIKYSPPSVLFMSGYLFSSCMTILKFSCAILRVASDSQRPFA